MIDLKHAVQEKGYTVAHIKTDSIKIPDADPYIINFVTKFGKKYGYDFEHEATYEKLCLVNDAVYVARKTADEPNYIAVGAQFQHPVVYKTLFTGEALGFDDYCETRAVQKGVIYLDLAWDKAAALDPEGMQFIGRIGRFVPVHDVGGVLYRVNESRNYALAGTKGWLWLEAEDVRSRKDAGKILDTSYSDKLVYDAKQTIEKFGSYEEFVS
jgi:hypothetical protein